MAIKGADLLHVGNKVLIERAQTAGPGTVNINVTKVYELGNYYSVGQVRDIPDLTFTCESLDASANIEAMLVGRDFQAMNAGEFLELSKARPLDVMSEFKPGVNAQTPYVVQGAVSLPYLVLESVGYRFGITDNAAQTVTLRGDSIFYLPGTGYVMEAPGPFAAGDTITVAAQPSDGSDGTVDLYPYNGDTVAGTRYVLSVATGSGRRMLLGADYTEAAAGTNPDGSRAVTLTLNTPVEDGDLVRISFSSPRPANYPQTTHTLASAVRPAAIRGRDIEVFLGGQAITNRWTSVQSVTVDYRVTLEKDEEFGNSQVVSQDFEVPDVTGSVELKPRDYLELAKRVRQIAGVESETEVAGALTSKPMPLDIVLHSPDPAHAGGVYGQNVNGQPSNVLKTLHIPDARFTLPGYSGRVQQKLTTSFSFSSDLGLLRVYKGARTS